MSNWSSAPHPISDIKDWHQDLRLELQPDFQRRAVWNQAARIMLMDTILQDIPMPKVFISAVIRGDSTYRIVIDGQQRISAILAFLNDEFALEPPYDGEYKSLKFSDLPQEARDKFLEYKIDFNEIRSSTEKELREIYSRVNKYTFALTKQELRRADYPGKFLDLSEELSIDEFLDSINLFTPANRRRLGDVEYISELLAALIDGPQNKKETLDDFYQKFAAWDAKEVEVVTDRFYKILGDIKQLFIDGDETAYSNVLEKIDWFGVSFPKDELKIARTRFRQKADFYSLFCAINTLHQDDYSLEGKDLAYLIADLKLFDYHTEPSSYIRDFREYAIHCVSDANSQSSRKWRQELLRYILEGTYVAKPPAKHAGELFIRIMTDIDDPSPMCPPYTSTCRVCSKDIEGNEVEQSVLSWEPNSSVYQVSNSSWIHKGCYESQSGWLSVSDIDLDQLNLFIDSEDGE